VYYIKLNIGIYVGIIIIYIRDKIFNLKSLDLIFKKSVNNVGMKLYYKLPRQLNLKMTQFSRKLKMFLLEHTLHTVEEYVSYDVLTWKCMSNCRLHKTRIYLRDLEKVKKAMDLCSFKMWNKNSLVLHLKEMNNMLLQNN
jgi:hypothetical protein